MFFSFFCFVCVCVCVWGGGGGSLVQHFEKGTGVFPQLQTEKKEKIFKFSL